MRRALCTALRVALYRLLIDILRDTQWQRLLAEGYKLPFGGSETPVAIARKLRA